MEKPIKNKSKYNLLSLISVIGPAIFLLVFIVEGFVRSDYSPLKDYVSALSLGSRGWVQITSFYICGLAVILLAFCAGKMHWNSRRGKAASILLGIFGISLFLSGLFVMDPAGTPISEMSAAGILHGVFGGMVFLLMPVVPLVFLGEFSSQRRTSLLTLIFSVIILIADIVFVVATKIPPLAAATLPFGGLLQRLVLIPFFIWLIILGFILYKTPDKAKMV